MKDYKECILMSATSNYDLAYRFRNVCKTHKVELRLAKTLGELLNSANHRTDAVVLEIAKKDWQQYSGYFSEDTTYKVYFVENDVFYNKQGEKEFESFDEFLTSNVFNCNRAKFIRKEVVDAIEIVFERFNMEVEDAQGHFVRELLVHMMLNNKRRFSQNELKVLALQNNFNVKIPYAPIARFLYKYYERIYKKCNVDSTKYNYLKVLCLLCGLIEQEIDNLPKY
ncbi:MAG: hypothetical protein IJA69_03935 [Clostridia bacterium]|nr:hypothetical protein [Clostridia bacterium]